MKKIEKKTWLRGIKEYFIENAHIFVGGLSIMNGSAYGYTMYRDR